MNNTNILRVDADDDDDDDDDDDERDEGVINWTRSNGIRRKVNVVFNAACMNDSTSGLEGLDVDDDEEDDDDDEEDEEVLVDTVDKDEFAPTLSFAFFGETCGAPSCCDEAHHDHSNQH
jgi:hypothetical protein